MKCYGYKSVTKSHLIMRDRLLIVLFNCICLNLNLKTFQLGAALSKEKRKAVRIWFLIKLDCY